MKIMNKKSYGSIPHLLGSRMGIGDKRITQGQHDFICKKKRKNDVVIVQEKLDGSCVSVFRKGDYLYALTRAGYEANTSPYSQHQFFFIWVHKNRERFLSVLKDGERIVGEWIIQAHGTKIKLKHEPFVAFDIMKGNDRLCYSDFSERLGGRFIKAHLVHHGDIITEEEIIQILEGDSYHGQDSIEGVVCRLETSGDFNYLAKYVRHDYEAGKFMKDEIFHENYKLFL